MANHPQLESPHYRSLTRRMILTDILVSLAPMLLVSIFILTEFQQSYREKLQDHVGELVLKHKQNIDVFLTERLANIRFMAGSTPFERLRDERFLQETLASLRRNFGTVFEDIGLVDETGHQIAYAGPFRLEHADYSKSPWFPQAITSDHYISDVFLGLREKPHFIVSARGESNGHSWILRATIDFLSFNALVENLRVGSTGFAFIVNRDETLQTRPMFTPPDISFYTLLKDAPAPPNGVHFASLPESGTAREAIYAGAFMKNGDWLLIFRQETADALSDLRSTQKVTLLILAVGGLAIMLTAVLFGRWMVERIASSDREKEMMNQQVIETGKLATIGELAAGIAHEINNPVAIMMEEAGWAEDLLQDESLKESENLAEFRRALGQIRIQGRRCKEITHKLLSFARKTDSRIQELDLNELIEEVVTLSAQTAKYGNVQIRTELRESLPTICMSHTELQQVLMNLINNALHALEKKKGQGVIDVRCWQEEGNVFIEVADNGPGIPAANMGRIFDPFFTTKPVGKGSGLGLSICYGIIHKLGGDITVKSQVDEGATFTIRIPKECNRPPDPLPVV